MPKLLKFLMLFYPVITMAESLNITHDPQLGGFSGLFFYQNKLFTLTDRGPNHEATDVDGNGTEDRIFPNPSYSPSILEIELENKNKTLTIKRTINLSKNKSPITGLPNQLLSTSKTSFDEDAFNLKKKLIKPDPLGIDPEGIAIDDNGHFWVCEEYGPSLLEFDSNGTFIRRLIPKKSQRQGVEVLPSFLNQRKLNRGFEGLTYANGKLYFVLQSPIPNKRAKKITHIFSLDPKNLKLDHFLYKQEKKKNKIGGLTHYRDNSFLIIEQNSKKKFQKVFKIKLDNPVKFTNSMLDIRSKELPTVSKQEYLDLKLPGIEKVEGIELHQGYIYLIEDNDFGLRNDAKKGVSNLVKIKAP